MHAINPLPSLPKPSRGKAFQVFYQQKCTTPTPVQVFCVTAYGGGPSIAPNVSFPVPAAAEDKLGWHGKTLPKDMAEMVIKDLQSRVMNSSKHLYPSAPAEDAPPVSLRNIRMPSAPSYKPGEKVGRHPSLCLPSAEQSRNTEY